MYVRVYCFERENGKLPKIGWVARYSYHDLWDHICIQGARVWGDAKGWQTHPFDSSAAIVQEKLNTNGEFSLLFSAEATRDRNYRLVMGFTYLSSL